MPVTFQIIITEENTGPIDCRILTDGAAACTQREKRMAGFVLESFRQAFAHLANTPGIDHIEVIERHD